MSTDDNKDLVRRFQDGMLEALRTGNTDPLLDTVDPNCVFGMPGMPSTLECMRQMLPAFRIAFSDMQVTVGEMIAEGDKVGYRLTATGVTLSLRVTPNAGADRIEGVERRADGEAVLRVRVAAAPDKGKANTAALALLARALGVPRTSLRLVAGETARSKRVAIAGDGPGLAALLQAAIGTTAP